MFAVCVFIFRVFGFPQAPPDWQEILAYFRGSELQNYFTKILEDDLKAIVKPQYVDQIPKTVKVNPDTSAFQTLTAFSPIGISVIICCNSVFCL